MSLDAAGRCGHGFCLCPLLALHAWRPASHAAAAPPLPLPAAEDHLFGDKEKFVTSAYRAKLAERQAWLEERKRKWVLARACRCVRRASPLHTHAQPSP